MSITPEEFRRAEEEAATADRQAAEAKGAYAELKRRLKKEFGFKTVREAAAECERLDPLVKAAEEEYRAIAREVADGLRGK